MEFRGRNLVKRLLSKQYNVVIVMKGAPTSIIDGDTVYQNTTGNAALATAGWRCLTGIITGFIGSIV
jgi:NAD(P)H-hydrate repair Nnr-like enzyme with NAD(P)H-hydrate dehydratase domain